MTIDSFVQDLITQAPTLAALAYLVFRQQAMIERLLQTVQEQILECAQLLSAIAEDRETKA